MNLQIKPGGTDVMAIGKAFAESGMFPDIRSAAQAIVKIQAGAELGIPPFASMTGIYIIKGKPAIGAGIMASMVKASMKYDYKVTEQSEKLCCIDYFEGKTKIGSSTFTIEDAKKAGTQNLDKFARNMLFARAMSNGVKWFCPDIFSGPVYVPEEFETEEPILTSKIQISDATFEAALVAVQKGALLRDGSKSVAEWLTQDVELSDERIHLLDNVLNYENDGTD